MVEEVPCDSWHEHDSEDSMRFYALRLQEVGSSTPKQMLADGTEWHFLNALERELKV